MAPIQLNLKDLLGKRGERLFSVMISMWHSNQGPIFNPEFLGGKQPAIDFIVHLLGAPVSAYFFAQVRATRQGYTRRDNRLKIKANTEAICAMADYPAPTYIVGIDEQQELGYIVSSNGEYRTAMSSLSTQFPIHAQINARNRVR